MAFASVFDQALSNSFISQNIRSNAYPRIVLMALLAGTTMMSQPTNTKVGRESADMILAGARIGDAKKEKMRNMTSYDWGFQSFTPNTATGRGAYGTMPVGTNLPANANSEVRANGKMPWTNIIASQVVIWNSTIRACINDGGTDYGTGVSIANMQENATATGMQDLITKIAPQFWTGQPLSYTTTPMTELAGIIAVCGTGPYANSTRVPATAIVSHTINATSGAGADDGNPISNDPQEMLRAVNGPGASIIANDQPIDTVLTDYNTYYKWKYNLQARGQIVQVVNSLPSMAAVGVIKEALQVDGRSYIMWDPLCPDTGANGVTAAFLSLRYWTFVTHPSLSWSMTPLVDISQTGVGNPDYTQAFCQVQPMLICEKPSSQAYVTNIV